MVRTQSPTCGRVFGESHELRSRLYFDQRQIGAGIRNNDLCCVAFAVVSCNGDCWSMLNDAIVGDRVAGGGNEKAGPLALDGFVFAHFVRH